MTYKSIGHACAICFKFSTKSALAVVVLVMAHAHANAQTLVNLPVAGVVPLPSYDGWPMSVKLSAGSTETVFGTGSYATTNDLENLGGAVLAMNVPSLQVGGVNGATISEQFEANIWGEPEPIRTRLNINTGISSLDIRTNSSGAAAIESLNMAGGITISGTRVKSVLTGGSLQINKIRANLATGQVLADLSGTKAAVGSLPAVEYSAPNTVMWTFDSVADTVVPPKFHLPSAQFSSYSLDDRVIAELQGAGYSNVHAFNVGTNGYDLYYYAFTAVTQINNLTLTSAGATFLSNALGLQATSQEFMNKANNSPGKWGSINASMTFTLVPEPATYGLMCLGLAGVALTERRRRPGQA